MLNKIKKNDQDLQNLEQDAVAFLMADLMALLAELTNHLSDFYEDDLLIATPGEVKGILTNLLTNYSNKFSMQLGQLIKDAAGKGRDHQIELLKTFLGIWIPTGAVLKLMNSSAKDIPEDFNPMTQNFITRFFASLYEKLFSSIQLNVFHKRTLKDLKETLTDDFSSQEATIIRSVLYISQTIYNKSGWDVLTEARKVNNKVRKEWFSVLDRKTTKVCQALDGQVREIDEPFVDPLSGSQFMFPPAVWGNEHLQPEWHPCRSVAGPTFDEVTPLDEN